MFRSLTLHKMEDRSSDLQSRSGEAIEKVDDFIYLGSWIESTDREIRVRNGKAWGALHRRISGNPNSQRALRLDCS